MIKVFAFPPVPAVGSEWTEHAPVQVSRSLVTGADYTSAAQRKRRLATVQVMDLDHGTNSAAGYMEVLKRLLEGIHAVRLRSYPINYYLDALAERRRRALPLLWTSDGEELLWTSDGEPLLWFSSATLTGTLGTAEGWPAITVSGLEPLLLAARPGEFIRVKADAADPGATAMVLTEAWADEAGVATIKLVDPLPYGGEVELATSDSAVFKPIGPYPRAVQTPTARRMYSWSFREVFAEEVGGFEEVDPW